MTNVRPLMSVSLKLPTLLPIQHHMISPTSSSHSTNATQASQAAQPTARQTQQQQSQTQQSTSHPQDTVTLSRAAQQGAAAQKSSSDVDHDGDNH